jgi:hypothetical protein
MQKFTLMAQSIEHTRLTGISQCSALPLSPFVLSWHQIGCSIPVRSKVTGVLFMKHGAKAKVPVSNEKKLNAGIKMVYRTYGPNLSTFFDAVQAELETAQKKSGAKADARFLKYRDK